MLYCVLLTGCRLPVLVEYTYCECDVSVFAPVGVCQSSGKCVSDRVSFVGNTICGSTPNETNDETL